MSEVQTPPVEVTPPKKSARIIEPQRMQLAEHWRHDWVVNAEEGTSVEDILDPQYWSHMAVHMAPFDRIEVRLETGEWIAELIVINSGRNWTQVFLAQKYDLTKRVEHVAAAQKHEVVWKGPQHRFTVVRRSDGSAVMNGFQTRELANEWLGTYERA